MGIRSPIVPSKIVVNVPLESTKRTGNEKEEEIKRNRKGGRGRKENIYFTAKLSKTRNNGTTRNLQRNSNKSRRTYEVSLFQEENAKRRKQCKRRCTRKVYKHKRKNKQKKKLDVSQWGVESHRLRAINNDFFI